MHEERADYRHRVVDGQRLRPETLMMGYGYDPLLSEGALKCPIFHTSTFVFETAEDGKAFFELAYGLREPKPREQLFGQDDAGRIADGGELDLHGPGPPRGRL